MGSDRSSKNVCPGRCLARVCVICLALTVGTTQAGDLQTGERNILPEEIPEEFQQECRSIFETCDLRTQYCDLNIGSCYSCEKECGENVLDKIVPSDERHIARERCQKICAVYYEQRSKQTTQTPAESSSIGDIAVHDNHTTKADGITLPKMDSALEHPDSGTGLPIKFEVVIGVVSVAVAGCVMIGIYCIIKRRRKAANQGKVVTQESTPHVGTVLEERVTNADPLLGSQTQVQEETPV